MIIWGGGWASGKQIAGLTGLAVLLFWRFLFTFLGLIPLVYLFEKNLKIHKKAVVFVVGGGLIMSVYNYFFFQGLRNGLAGAGGVLVTTLNPVLTFLLSSLITRHRLTKREAIGLTLGLLGGLVMIKIWRLSFNELILSGNLFFVLASISWACMTLISQYSAKVISAPKFSLYVHGIAALLSFSIAFNDDWTGVLRFSGVFWLNIFYLSIISTAFGTTLYFAASQKLGSKTASSFIFIVPASALLCGIIFLKESADIVLLCGGGLSLAAVYLINAAKSGNLNRRPKAEIPVEPT